MGSPPLSYSEAAELVQRYIQAVVQGSETVGDTNASGSISPPSADIRFEDCPRPHPAMVVPLAIAAGRVLAQQIFADRDQPPFSRATRDGFACRAAEASSNLFLFLAGRARAGQPPASPLASGEVWEIMTGAPVPEGADAVFMVEHADQNSNFVRLPSPRTLQTGENIVLRAAEARSGDLLVAPGVRLGAAQIALAAQCGYGELAVASQPRVAILSTGDELVNVEAAPGPSQIRNSNSPMLAALVAEAGGAPTMLPASADQQAPLDAAIAQALPADLLLITGGISAGRFDLVEDALTRAGARFFFGGVAIQPGKPVVFGQLPRPGQTPLPFFALPGNPISSAVTFHLFAAPVLAALAGDSTPLPRLALAQATGEWRGKPGLTRFLPASCDFGSNVGLNPQVRLVPWQGSGDIAAFAKANCFLAIPAEATEILKGSIVRILLV